ncbi:hypothetical protein NBRC116583_39210 [Arenicella sp. 4NH20-0111]|uniref:hypothetical protein n=1 Tax=Arenicella sp. 4NH20-0111 TaxID=3127648 RepID=UPI003108330C
MNRTPNYYAIVLYPDSHPNLIDILDGYVEKIGTQIWLECDHWEQNGNFIFANVIHQKEQREWEVNIPLGSVLAITNHSDKKELGFKK